MRKIIASLCAIAFVCSLSIGLVGCGGNKASSSKSTSTPTGGTTASTSTSGTGAATGATTGTTRTP